MNKILDIEISFDRKEIIDTIDRYINHHHKGYIVTINSNIMVNAYKNDDYKSILNNSSFNICDGSVLATALNIINGTKYNSYPGPDFFMDRIKEKKYKHAFLGSTKEVLNGLKTPLAQVDECLSDSLFIELPFLNVNDYDYYTIGNVIQENAPDFIWVSLGAPKQEEFSALLIKHITKGLIVPVGAAFEFYSNNSKVGRSPGILRKFRLEWFFRLYKQPLKTFKRLKNEFFYMPIILFKEIVKSKYENTVN